MTFLIRHLLLAGDPQRYSEIPPPEGCSLAKVPLDLLDTTSEIDEFSVRDKNSDNTLCKSEISEFGIQTTNCDKTSCTSEITGFALEPVE